MNLPSENTSVAPAIFMVFLLWLSSVGFAFTVYLDYKDTKARVKALEEKAASK